MSLTDRAFTVLLYAVGVIALLGSLVGFWKLGTKKHADVDELAKRRRLNEVEAMRARAREKLWRIKNGVAS